MIKPADKERRKINIIEGSEPLEILFVVILLFSFWLLLSGNYAPKYVIIGLMTAVVVTWVTRPFLRLPSIQNPDNVYLAFRLSYIKIFLYVLWLFKEIIKANIYVVKLVLNPKMPIDPVIISLRKNMDHPLAHTILGICIVLTPGTLPVEIDDGLYVVHAITREISYDLAPEDGQEAEMPKLVGELFSKKDKQ